MNSDPDPFAASPSASGPIRDAQWFALSWYGQTMERICHGHDLEMLVPDALRGSRWFAMPGLETGHLVAASPGLLARPFEPQASVACGGPCIGDCGSFPTLEALYDTVQPLLVASALQVPALLYIGDQEEILEHGGPGRWLKLGERIEGWVRAIADLIGPPDCRVVRTSSAVHRVAVEAGLESLRAVPEADLDGAFHLAETPPRAQGDAARAVARRVVAAHLPQVVAAHVPAPGPAATILMCENLQQAGVWRVASAALSGEPGRVELLAHWPAPGLSGGERMFRAGSHDKAPAWALAEIAGGDISGVHPYTVDFFARWLAPELCRQLARRAEEAWRNPPPR